MKTLAGLVVGGRGTLSMGRAILWIFVGLSVYFWLAREVEAFPPSLETALAFALAYNLGGKAVNNFSPTRRSAAPGRQKGREFEHDHDRQD
jgi:hypothetical protein